MYEPDDPPCGGCIVELDEGNYKAWQLWELCRNQLLRAGVDGTIVGLNIGAVCSILKFYGEDEKMLDKILLIWSINQELST